MGDTGISRFATLRYVAPDGGRARKGLSRPVPDRRPRHRLEPLDTIRQGVLHITGVTESGIRNGYDVRVVIGATGCRLFGIRAAKH
jgi:hypothetical protein